MLAVIRIRGMGRIEKSVVDTLKILGLSKNHGCSVLEKNPVNEGMLKKVKDFVTWGEIKPDVLKQLEDKKGKGRFFSLAPPKGGFSKRGIVGGFKQGGELGYRGEKINELLGRMI